MPRLKVNRGRCRAEAKDLAAALNVILNMTPEQEIDLIKTFEDVDYISGDRIMFKSKLIALGVSPIMADKITVEGFSKNSVSFVWI